MESWAVSEEMETFWFFWLRLRCSYDSVYNSEFWFSLGHKRSYHSAYNSDSVASEKAVLGKRRMTIMTVFMDSVHY